MVPGEVDELPCSLDHRPTFRRPCNGDATAAPELEQALVAEHPQRTQHGVGVDAEDRGEVLRGRKALTRLRLPIGNCTPDLTGDLLEEIGGVALVYLDKVRV